MCRWTYAAIQWLDVYPFMNTSHPMIFWCCIVVMRLCGIVAGSWEGYACLASYGMSKVRDNLRSKVTIICIGVLMFIRHFRNCWRKILWHEDADGIRHWQMWSIISTEHWHHGHKGGGLWPWKYRDSLVRIHPCISFTIDALLNTFKRDMWHCSVHELNLLNFFHDRSCFWQTYVISNALRKITYKFVVLRVKGEYCPFFCWWHIWVKTGRCTMLPFSICHPDTKCYTLHLMTISVT